MRVHFFFKPLTSTAMDSSTLRIMIFLTIIGVMAVWETLAAKRSGSQPKAKRWLGNISLIVVDTLVVRLLIPAGAIGAAAWADVHHIGLLHQFGMPDMASVIIAIILLDMAIYAQHVFFHAVPILWRLHMVHHADCDLDVSSGLRFHPVEILLSMLIKLALVVLIGAPVLAVLLFEAILNGMAMFNHANVRMPGAMDRLLRIFVVTPDMHRVHHSVLVAETNSNFGFNLSLWDRMFGTYTAQPSAGHQNMTIGLTQFQQQPTYRLDWMLALPFVGKIGQYPWLNRTSGEQKEP